MTRWRSDRWRELDMWANLDYMYRRTGRRVNGKIPYQQQQSPRYKSWLVLVILAFIAYMIGGYGLMLFAVLFYLFIW